MRSLAQERPEGNKSSCEGEKKKKEREIERGREKMTATNNKEPILIISPTELKFKFELKKQIPATLVLQNPATHTVAFKIKTTTPKKYCVRPSTGFVLPQSKVPIQIMMSSQKEKPVDFEACRDKFLVQSVKLSDTEAEQPISADLFSKVGGKDVHEFKLRVSYGGPEAVSPPQEVIKEKEVETTEQKSNGVTSNIPSAQKSNSTTSQSLQTKKLTLQGFSLLHLFLAALVAFFIGRMT